MRNLRVSTKLLLLTAACGGGEHKPPPPTVSVSPPSITVAAEAHNAFTATVLGGTPATVTWSVQGGDAGGTIDAGGDYTAPAQPGAYTVIATSDADSTITATASVTVRPLILTVMTGANVSGAQAAGVTQHAGGDSVTYGYSLGGGLVGLTVELDGAVVPASGTVPMHTDRWLLAFGQPASGTSFPGVIAVPDDPTIVPYPEFYTTQPMLNLTVADPYCAATSDMIVYPSAFLGAFPMPAISGGPLDAAVKRGVFLKDYWGTNPAIGNTGCTGDWHAAVTASMQRLKKLGADHVGITQSAVIADSTVTPMHFECWGGRACNDQSEISDTELAWAANEALSLGLTPYFYMQVGPQDANGVPLPTAPTSQFVNAFFDAFAEFMVHEGTVNQAAGYSVMEADWAVWWLDWTQPQYESVYQTRLTDVATQLRAVYSGKLFLGSVAPWASDNAALMAQMDYLLVDLFGIPFQASDNTSISTATMVPKYQQVIGNYASVFGKYGKPVMFRVQVESYRDYFLNGFLEDGFCVNGCVQNSTPTDFSIQAIAVEAQLEAISTQTAFTAASVDVGAYWPVDVILPAQSFPNISHSIRNKPAESIVFRWFQ